MSAGRGGRAGRVLRLREMVAQQQFAAARAEAESLLRVDPRDRDLLVVAARACNGLRLHQAALAFAERAAAAGADAATHLARAEAFRGLGRTDEAIADFRRAAQLDPASTDGPLGVVSALEEAGRTEQARAALDEVVAQLRAAGKPPTPKCRFEDARLLVHEKRYAEAIAAVDALLPLIPPGFRQRRMTLQLRVKACDRSGDYDGAWESAQRALAEERVQHDPAQLERRIDATIAHWTRERVRAAARSEVDDPAPVFVAGMPRSGTSLLEQLAAAHPQGGGVGELQLLEHFAESADAAILPEGAVPRLPGAVARAPDARACTEAARAYLATARAMCPDAARIVNKSLHNDRMAAHLSLLFPATRIVHIERDPRDVAVSCALGGFNLLRLPWTARPDWTAHAWTQSRRLMRHWAQVLEVPLLHVRYEELVQSGEPAFRRYIEFLGLPWDDAVTRFHQSKRTVLTLSYDQVNKPLYTNAVGRWRNYARHLEGVAWPE
ncbi:MAG: sulfotransferase [Phycisphaerales bacterium]